MIIFLYGPDTYRSGEKLREITARYKDTQNIGASLSYFNKGDNDFNDFKNVVDTVSMFDDKKLVVLRDLLGSKDFSDKFFSWDRKNYVKDSTDTVCVFVDEEIDKRSKLFKWLTKNSQSQEFKMLDGAALTRWAKKYTEKNGFEIDGMALGQLISYTGPDLWLLAGELAKLGAYTHSGPGQEKKITSDDLSVFLKPKLHSHIFSFLDAVVLQDASKAFKFLKGHIEAGDSAIYIFSMLHHQFRNVATVQHFLDKGEAANIVKETKLHPYVVKKSISFSKNLGNERIKKIYSRIVELDRKIKTGETDAEEAIETLILRI